MRVDAQAEGLLERMAMGLGLMPVPLVHTQLAFVLARAVMGATEVGVFENLRDRPATAEALAKLCGTDEKATRALLGVLVTAGYLTLKRQSYALTPMARKWMLKDSDSSVRDKILFQLLEWDWTSQMEKFLRSGKPVEMHSNMNPDQWALYQRGMRASVRAFVPEVVRRTPMPRQRQRMLDIGGSHGQYSAGFCRRYPTLRSTVLDLPEAVEEAQLLNQQEKGSERVEYRAGNALTDDLGENEFDLVFAANVVHHFTAEQNVALTGKVFRALKPGGIYVIQEFIRPTDPNKTGQLGCLLDLFFALTSASGTWSLEEMAQWQRDAGFQAVKPVRFLTVPGFAQQTGTRPTSDGSR